MRTTPGRTLSWRSLRKCSTVLGSVVMKRPVATRPVRTRIERAVAALCVVVAALGMFFFVLNPLFVDINAKARAQLAQEIARENEIFCEKRGFAAGTRRVRRISASCAQGMT